MFPHDSYVPTMLGCSASLEMMSESRSWPAVTDG